MSKPKKKKKKKYDGPELWVADEPYICCYCNEKQSDQYYKPWNSGLYCSPCWESISFDSDNEFGEHEVVQAFVVDSIDKQTHEIIPGVGKTGLVVGGAPVGWPGGWLQVVFDNETKISRVWHQHLSYTKEGRISRTLLKV